MTASGLGGHEGALGGGGSPFALPTAPAGPQLRTRGLHDALAQAALVAEPPQIQRTVDFARVCTESRALVIGVTAALAVAILLITRPPFALRFEYDSRRPWKGTMRISWRAITITVLLVAAAAAGAPLLVRFAESESP